MRTRPSAFSIPAWAGLTVMRALMARLPHESFVYLGDTARLPYGTKSADTVDALCGAGGARADARTA